MELNTEYELKKTEKRWKPVLFTIFGVIFSLGGLFFLESLLEGLLPWVTVGCPGCEYNNPNYDVNDYRWFGATHGALVGIMLTGSLIALLWKPWTKPLLLQYYIIGHVWFILSTYFIMEPNPTALPLIEVIFVLPSIILAFLYPGKDIWTNPFKHADFHRPLIVWTVIVAAFMLPVMRDSLWMHFNSDTDPARLNRWLGIFDMSTSLIVASLVAATRKPGWKQLTILIGSAFIYLGLAALSVPENPGSWGVWGGIASILGGIGYIVCAVNKKWNKTE